MENTKQRGLFDLIGEVAWEDRQVAVSALPEAVGPPPDAALVGSIREVGILTPILLIEVTPESLEIIDGNRRLMAARQLLLEEVPARVATGADALALKYSLGLISNEQRSSNPAAEYEAISALMGSWGMDDKTIAKALGIPVATVRKRMALANMIPFWMRRFRAGFLGATLAERIAKLSPEEQERLIQVVPEGKRVTLDHVAEIRKVGRSVVQESILSTIPIPEAVKPSRETSSGNPLDEILERVASIRHEVQYPGADLPIRVDQVLAEIESLVWSLRGGGS